MTSYTVPGLETKNNIRTTKREVEQEDTMTDRSFEGRREQQEEVEVAEGHELNVMPKNEDDKKREEIITAVASRGLSHSKKWYSKKIKQKQPHQRNLKDVLNQIKRQSILIHSISTNLQPILKQTKIIEKHSVLVKQIQIEIKQLQKQTSQIQRIKLANKKK
jgi:hypothetical protein